MGISNNKAITEISISIKSMYSTWICIYTLMPGWGLSVSLPFCLVPELWSNSSDLTEAMEVKSRRINVQLKCFLVNMVASVYRLKQLLKPWSSCGCMNTNYRSFCAPCASRTSWPCYSNFLAPQNVLRLASHRFTMLSVGRYIYRLTLRLCHLHPQLFLHTFPTCLFSLVVFKNCILYFPGM